MTQPQMPWWVLPSLAGLALMTFAGTIVGAYAVGEKQLAANLSIGALALATTSFGYFFQSSLGSSKKDDNLAAIAAAPVLSGVSITAGKPTP